MVVVVVSEVVTVFVSDVLVADVCVIVVAVTVVTVAVVIVEVVCVVVAVFVVFVVVVVSVIVVVAQMPQDRGHNLTVFEELHNTGAKSSHCASLSSQGVVVVVVVVVVVEVAVVLVRQLLQRFGHSAWNTFDVPGKLQKSSLASKQAGASVTPSKGHA